MEKKAENIMRTPQRGFLVYGDFYSSEIRDIKNVKDQDGKDCVEFELNPTDPLIKDYNIKPVPPREDCIYTVRLPLEFVRLMNYSPHFTRWFCLKTYDGIITPQMKSLFDTELHQEIQDLKALVRRMGMEVDVARENESLAKTDVVGYMKKNVFDIMKEMAPTIQSMMPKEDKK
jgi:hypothetical protein